jgi:GNAT superfamily N-acetyltransferase
MNITIREAGLDDVPHILHHRVRMFEDMGKGSSKALSASSGTFLREAMPRGRYRGWLAVTGDGRVVAGVGVTIVDWPGSPDDPAPRRGWIQNVYTEPEFRRKGVARRLMQTAIEWCGQAGFVHISLHASVYGRRLYEELGFVPTNEMRLLLKK